MLNLNNNKVIEKDLLELVYPVGSIYMSVNNISPSVLFGGTWEAIQDRFLLASGSTFAAGNTGGAVNHTPSGSLSNTSITPAGTLSGGAVGNHTLTVAEMPSHNHCPYILLGGYSGWGNLTTGGNNSAYMYKWTSDNIYNTNAATYTDHATNSPLTLTSNTGSGGAHNHPFTQPTFKGTAASHGHTFTGTSQDTMPPYLAVYIWKRVS